MGGNYNNSVLSLGFTTAFILLIIEGTNALNCYYCTNAQISSTSIIPHCDTSSKVPEELLVDCAIGANISMFTDPMVTLFGSRETTGITKNRNNKKSESEALLSFTCLKISAKVNNLAFIIRGCAPGISNEIGDTCQKIDDGLNVGNLTMKKTEVCFCKKDGCNIATNLQQSFIIVIIIGTLTRILV